jgi:signal transduction histidine kinase/DNA-binding response OmpR family regulator/ligand-binding sensor domain-containing protein
MLPQLIIFLITAQAAFAQQRLLTNQQHFTVEDGLPQNFISGILQDDDGFIWIATMDGLCRYDGRVFKTFHYNSKDSNSLASNTINNVGRFQNNTITVHYTLMDADDFNLRSFKASRNNIPKRLNKIAHAHWQPYHVGHTTANWLFIMDNNKGMGWLDSKTGKTFYANRANGLLQHDTISAAIESKEGRIYLVSENGLHVSNTNRSKFEWIPFATNVKKETINSSRGVDRFSMAVLPGNRLLVAERDKVILLDINNRTSKFIPPPAEAKTGLGFLNCEVQVDTKGRAYFENGGRIFRITETGEMKLLWENILNPALRISAFFIDRSDVLWLSVNAQGLLKIDLQSSAFETYRYRKNFIADILEQAGAKLNMPLNEFTRVEASYTLRQAIDKKGNYFVHSSWLGNENVYQLQQQKLSTAFQIPSQFIYQGITVMPDNDIWALGHDAFVWYFWKRSSPEREKLMLDKETMASLEVTDAKFLGGSVWITTYKNGLLQYASNKKISSYVGVLQNGKMPESLTEICADPVNSNQFWIGSRGGGLILWDVQKGLQHIYTTDDGLPNNTIYCILPDKAGKIWCSTNKGIFRFDKTSGQVTAFEKTDGLPGNEFNRAHKFMFPDGRLAFGGLDGYTIFNPANFDSNKRSAEVPVMLTGLQVNNQPQGIEIINSFIKEPLNTLSVVDLPYNKNNLRFEFTGMLFNQQQKTKYRYMLKGADEQWIENGTNNIAPYTALSPGNYTLRINASDITGQWSNYIKEIKVVIHPPFWATWWARVIYALVIIALVRWYFIFRERQLKAKQNLAFEKRESFRLKEVDELKDRFFSNITHELRTPLTLIITPLEKLEQDPSLSPAAVSTVKTAQRNSKQLLKLINEFLDFSKLNDGQLRVKLSSGELHLFVADCVKSFDAAAKEKNIDLQLSTGGISGFYFFDEEKWEKIINNLVSNAIKFTPQEGIVAVSLSSSTGDNIKLEVKDNGPGVPLAQQEKIFDRFYQADDSFSRNVGGTGIGLSLVKELTGLMQGTITIESKPAAYTSFTVSIPVKKAMGIQPAPEPVEPLAEKQTAGNVKPGAPLLLLVEDNDALRSFLAEMMCNHYQVMEASNGLTAWEMIINELPDVVISDVMMPGKDGFDLCKLCKEDHRTAHIGFILLTSKAAHDARLRGLGAGADDYITKPFNLQELELRTANLLQLKQKQRAWLQTQLITSSPQQELPVITDSFLIQLYKEMDAKLDDSNLGVDYLSRTMAMSRSTLNRKLKSLLDISTNDLVRQYRLQKAAALLRSGMDISTVAYQVGFSSPSYFSQCFKEKYGITPSEHLSGKS